MNQRRVFFFWKKRIMRHDVCWRYRSRRNRVIIWKRLEKRKFEKEFFLLEREMIEEIENLEQRKFLFWKEPVLCFQNPAAI